MYTNFSNIERITDALSQDIDYIIDEILGKDGFEYEKLELLSSVLFLFNRRANEAKALLTYKNKQYNNTVFPFNTPYSNTCFFNPLTVYNPIKNFGNFQFPMSTMSPSNFYNFPNPQFRFPFQYPSQIQFQQQIQPQNPIYQPQQPNFMNPSFYSNTNEPNEHSTKDSKKSSHKKKDKSSKSHKEKSKSKDEKSKSKKTKSKSKTKSKDSNYSIENFEYRNQDFQGIINYLTSKTGGNIHDNGTIEVTSNSILNDRDKPKNLLNSSGLYATIRGDKNAWVCFDFKNMKIKLTDYTIRSASSCNIKNWVIETSDDNSEWKVIDNHNNCTDLEKWGTVKTYHIGNSQFSRYCRLRHTGDFCEYKTQNTMQIERIEFYGQLKTPK